MKRNLTASLLISLVVTVVFATAPKLRTVSLRDLVKSPAHSSVSALMTPPTIQTIRPLKLEPEPIKLTVRVSPQPVKTNIFFAANGDAFVWLDQAPAEHGEEYVWQEDGKWVTNVDASKISSFAKTGYQTVESAGGEPVFVKR